jgi:hypothetical protein
MNSAIETLKWEHRKMYLKRRINQLIGGRIRGYHTIILTKKIAEHQQAIKILEKEVKDGDK